MILFKSFAPTLLFCQLLAMMLEKGFAFAPRTLFCQLGVVGRTRSFSLSSSSSSSSLAAKSTKSPHTSKPAPSGRPATSLPPVPENAHRIVLMRHGESEFNNANIFTGWCDVALTPRGEVEATEAGEVFLSHHLTFRQCYCSMLSRSIITAHRSLEAGGVSYTPISYDWRLNERHYGTFVVETVCENTIMLL